MTKPLDQILDELIGREGRYSNNPSDVGGETMWGITLKVARQHRYFGEMRLMPRSEAVRIYTETYWKNPGFDQVALISDAIAEELLDTGVNMGVGKACEFLQVSLNALNRQGKDYPDIAEDGVIGIKTLTALGTFLRVRKGEGQEVLLKALNCLQGARYIEISRMRGANEEFTYGWIKNRVAL